MSPVSNAALIASRYRLDHQLASDHVAEVWQGTDLELARPIAVKLLRAGAHDADAVGQFRAAACRAASLEHENLVRVFDYCEPGPSDSPQCPFLVMELVDGQLLSEVLDSGPLSARRTVEVAAQLAAALHVVHEAGLTHGDIRPEKILLRHDGAAKLFGLSGSSLTGSLAIAGDLRALGVMARECLTGSASPGGSGPLCEQVPASVTRLVAELCAHASDVQPEATAAIARRAAALHAQLDHSARADYGGARSAGSPAPPGRGVAPPASIVTFPRPPYRPSGPAAAPSRQAAVAPVGQSSTKHRNLVAMRAAAVIAIALAAVAILGALKPNGSTPQAEGATQPASIRVAAAKLIGRPVDAVRHRLEQLGLVVRVQWRESASVSAGEVVAVRPAGLVPVHSVVVIFGSRGRSVMAAAPAVAQAQDSHRHRHPPRFAAYKPAPRPSKSAPSPSPSISPASSASPTNSPSPPGSPSPTGSPSPSSSPPSDSTKTAR